MSHERLLKESNLYAERIYAEHPLALWPFDDDISFLQLFTGTQQDLSDLTYWSHSNLNVETIEDYPTIPITSSPQSRYSLSGSASNIAEISSVFSVSSSSFFTDEKGTACFSTYVYQPSIFISYFRIGVSYDGQDYYTEQSFGPSIGWKKISHSFDIPENKNISFFIQVKFSEDPFATQADYEFQVNGTSLGQWSEQYNSKSIGFNDVPLPSEISHLVSSSADYTSVIADAYGLDEENTGYYLIKNKNIYARNSGLPLVYGSKNSTRILTAPDNNPSILIPGQGFLNDAGKHSKYTFESWIRLDNLSADPIRIIGPIASDDGIYVEEGYISLKVGNKNIGSYFIGKWYRPMLLHFKYSPEQIYLYINGAEVISQQIDISSMSFPSKYDGNNNQDWIGIYGNDLIDPFEIDCVSIMPYLLPIEMSKRRFVYGQGVDELEPITSYYSSERVFFDYSNSEYASNMLYPDMNSWNDAFSVNLQATSSFLQIPEYELPEFFINSTSISYDDWKEANRQENINNPDNFKYFKISPPSLSGILEADPSFYFDDINILNENVRSIVGVFKADDAVENQQPLMVFRNNATRESLRIMLNPDLIKVDGGTSSTTSFEDAFDYGEPDTTFFTATDDFGSSITDPDEDIFTLQYIYTNYDGAETLIKQEYVEKMQYFNAGIDIKGLQQSFNGILNNFFSSPSNISLTIGKYRIHTMLGRIYNLHFINDFHFEKDVSSYFENGIVIQRTDEEAIYEDLLTYTANYSLIPYLYDSEFDLDIGVVGYWEDVQPLSYFGKYITSDNGEKYYDLDMIQFNIDSPKRSQIDPSQTTFYTTYDSLKLIYAQNDDLKLSGTYNDIKSASADYSINRIETSVSSYVTLKDSVDAGTKKYSDYQNISTLPTNKVIDFDISTRNNTKYEIEDRSIIMAPDDNFENYFLGIHLEVKVRGINKKKFSIRRLELSSMSLNNSAPTKIGTRHYESVYPFSRNNFLFDYKKKNPLTIYKDSSPYLYLTDDSGMYANEYDTDYSRGFFVPVNKNKEENFPLGSIQVWMRYPEDSFQNQNKPAMSVINDDSNFSFYLYPESDGKRAILKNIDSQTGVEIKNAVYFQDGEIVDYPIIYPKRWTSVIISFLDPVVFSNYTGRIEFYSGILFNNISKYIYTPSLVNSSRTVFKQWFQILYNESTEQTWNEWSIPSGQTSRQTWKQGTATLEPNQYTIDGERVYKGQIGGSISVTDDNSRLSVYSNGANVFTDVTWEVLEKSSV